MVVRLVNRRGKTMRYFLCAIPTSQGDQDAISRLGWRELDGTYLFGSKHSTPQWSGDQGLRVTTLSESDMADGDSFTLPVPEKGALLWVRGEKLAGPWWLAPPPKSPGSAVYRPDETRLVLTAGSGSAMLQGIDGIIAGAEAQYAGRIRKAFVAAGPADPSQTRDPEAVLLEAADILIAGVSTFLSSAGPITGLFGGVLVLSGGLLNAAADEAGGGAADPDVDAIGQRMQAIMDDRDAAVMATTLVTTEDELSDHRQNLIEAVIASSAFTDEERRTYYAWKAGTLDPGDAVGAKTLLRIRAKLNEFFNPQSTSASPATPPDPMPRLDAYRAFLREALGVSNDTFFWCMNHLAANRSLLRRCLPEFILGMGVYAAMAPDAIIADVNENRTTLTPSLYRDVATDISRYVDALTAALDEIRGEMTALIDKNGLSGVPERIEVLRFYSERFLGSGDVLFDKGLAAMRLHQSFGVHYGEYWNFPSYVYGPLIDRPIISARSAIVQFNNRASRLQAAGASA